MLWDAGVFCAGQPSKNKAACYKPLALACIYKYPWVPQLATNISFSPGLQRDRLETLFALHLMKNHVPNPPTLEGFATFRFRAGGKKLSDELSGPSSAGDQQASRLGLPTPQCARCGCRSQLCKAVFQFCFFDD